MRSKPAVLGCVLCTLIACDLLDADADKGAESGKKDASAESTEADAATKKADKGETPTAPEPKAEVELGALERRPASSPVDAAGRPVKAPIRGPIAWKPPAHWTARRDSGKPFILGEYGLAGHTDDKPALCRLIHNSSWSSKKTTHEQAVSEAKRTRLRDEEGKSLLSKLTPKLESIGELKWQVVFAKGRYRTPVLMAKTPPEEMLPGYAQMNLIPEVEGVRVALRCWAPEATLETERAAILAWAASVQYPAEG